MTSYIIKAFGQSAITSVTTKDSQNVRPPKEAWKPVFESGVEDWLEHRAPESTDKESTLKLVNFIKKQTSLTAIKLSSKINRFPLSLYKIKLHLK